MIAGDARFAPERQEKSGGSAFQCHGGAWSFRPDYDISGVIRSSHRASHLLDLFDVDPQNPCKFLDVRRCRPAKGRSLMVHIDPACPQDKTVRSQKVFRPATGDETEQGFSLMRGTRPAQGFQFHSGGKGTGSPHLISFPYPAGIAKFSIA